MRTTTCLAVALAVAASAPLGAQAGRGRRAFEPAVTVAGTVTAFGQRLDDPLGDYEYKNSIGVAVWGDLPLTRRTGLVGVVTVTPFSKQRAQLSEANTALYDNVISYSADLTLGGRLKPGVPVFFLVGGGVHGATRYAIPGADGGAVEPQGTFAVGYDAARRGRWNIRAAFVGHVVKPADPEMPTVSPQSTAFDWSIHLGAHYLLSPATTAPGGAP